MKSSLLITLTILAAIVQSGLGHDKSVVEPTPTSAGARTLETGAQTRSPTGERILEQVDANMTSESSIVASRMVIHGRRESRTIASRSWSRGEDTAFTEYLAPAREKGTKMLKLGDRLWLYSPGTDRTIQLSGHMLRQSVMGSDLSYEDMMDDPRLAKLYEAEVTGTETVDERPCWVLLLVAKEKDVAYQSRKLWVDKERMVPVREELHAKSGKLLKRVDLANFRQVDSRWYPMRMTFKDMLKKGNGTEFVIDEIQFDQDIPAHLLTKAALRR